MQSIAIESGPVRVISSGTVISFDKNPIEITMGGSGRCKVIMIFHDEEGEGKSFVRPRVIGSRTIELTFVNFKDPLGSGNVKPIHFATIGGLTIFMNYRIYSYLDSDKTVHYTFYCSQEDSLDKVHTEGFNEWIIE
ncbi:hypothetical protein LI82_06005 [Methanococcoides methylutens]|uniref:Uncharacterized protein n=1 Tax=Methanococcoides methylutens TaxID=2226 RepID=A0A099T114_METMT|nr:hypothetical protein [Methanococcoides methylutens]KGK98847.1 hypothetical protein LI82_06005 [Methanococcoides methylutens]